MSASELINRRWDGAYFKVLPASRIRAFISMFAIIKSAEISLYLRL